MKECLSCQIFYKESSMRCEACRRELTEVTLSEALAHTRKKLLRHFSERHEPGQIFDVKAYYLISRYFRDPSLFLSFDFSKNEMKYGPRFPRFFIQPINVSALVNIPWFAFNVLYSNYFHLRYTAFCPQCWAKYRPGQHSAQDCAYYQMYFHILRDVLNGEIVHTRRVYAQTLASAKETGASNAYGDLCERHTHIEIFLDMLSIGFSVFLWIYLAVYVSYPMVRVLIQKMSTPDAYEFRLF